MPSTQKEFSATIMNLGFIFGLILAGACLCMASYYMFSYQENSRIDISKVVDSTLGKNTNTSLNIDYEMIRMALSTNAYISRVLLISCGMFIGLSFGFLGFSLSLIGVRGDVDANLEGNSKYKIQITRLSPGLFVILCATILVFTCLERDLHFELKEETSPENNKTNKQTDSATKAIHKAHEEGLPQAPDTTMPSK